MSQGQAIEFQDIAHRDNLSADPSDLSLDVDGKIEEGKGLLDPEDPGRQPANDGPEPSLCSMAYFQRYFDVNTRQVIGRVGRSLLPISHPFFPPPEKPDLYGPFWVCFTLVFLMAATGNVASYFAFSSQKDVAAQENLAIEKLSIAATVFSFTIFIVPLLVWVVLGHVGVSKSFVEIMSLYGYSLSIYIPACVICMFPIEWLRWTTMAVSFGISGSLVLRNIYQPQLTSYILLGVIGAYHAGLAVVTKFYFFDFS